MSSDTNPQTNTQADFALSLSASGGGDFGPNMATVSITREWASEILEIAEFVRMKAAHKLETFDSRVKWFDDEDCYDEHPEPKEIRTECDALNVGREEFWFTCYPKHIENKAMSSKTTLAALAAHFGLNFPAASGVMS